MINQPTNKQTNSINKSTPKYHRRQQQSLPLHCILGQFTISLRPVLIHLYHPQFGRRPNSLTIRSSITNILRARVYVYACHMFWPSQTLRFNKTCNNSHYVKSAHYDLQCVIFFFLLNSNHTLNKFFSIFSLTQIDLSINALVIITCTLKTDDSRRLFPIHQPY
jgi:hypothetical protein